jgi:hypothetical protein
VTFFVTVFLAAHAKPPSLGLQSVIQFTPEGAAEIVRVSAQWVMQMRPSAGTHAAQNPFSP